MLQISIPILLQLRQQQSRVSRPLTLEMEALSMSEASAWTERLCLTGARARSEAAFNRRVSRAFQRETRVAFLS
jgi:hypothetical protein